MLTNKIENDLKVALKARDTIKVETLRMLKAALSNFLIEKRKTSADEAELVGLIQKQVKLRSESIESYRKAGRMDLVEKETREKSILEEYLPTALSREELLQIVKASIERTGAKTTADMGKVMKEALTEARGRADGRAISELVTHLLNPNKAS